MTRRDGVEILRHRVRPGHQITTGDYAGTYSRTPASPAATSAAPPISRRQPRDHRRARTAHHGDTSDTSDSSSLFLLDINAADIEAGLARQRRGDHVPRQLDRPGSVPARAAHRAGSATPRAPPKGNTRPNCAGSRRRSRQGIVRTYGVGCDAELGDARCRVDMTPFTHDATPSSVVDQPTRVSTTPVRRVRLFGQRAGRQDDVDDRCQYRLLDGDQELRLVA